MAGTYASADLLALSVHGPVGVLDLVVPASATAADVAEEYAARAGLDAVPVLRSRLGHRIESGTTLARAGIAAGALLVADPVTPAAPADPADPGSIGAGRHAARRGGVGGGPSPAPGASSVLWLAVAVAAAGLAGWCAATAPAGGLRASADGLLLGAAVLGVIPVGRLAAHRVVAAPAFGGAAAFALVWDPHDVRVPMVLGVTGLAAALVAAVGRALAPGPEEALRVWVLAGVAAFLVTGLGTLGGAPPRLVWALVLLGALLAARSVPTLAVDVPDQYLIDLDRLAVTAWSAREQPGGRRGRAVVPLDTVGVVAARGTRVVTAASAAVLAAVLVAAPLLLATATLPLDRIGARVLVGSAAAALLLAARSYRHPGARALLRTAGLACGAALVAVLLPEAGRIGSWVGGGAVLVATALVVAAVAVGRGWRSAWWSRRAEVVEGLTGAVAVAALVVASGWFRQLWELASLWELGS